MKIATLLFLFITVVSALENNLDPLCGGTGPDAIISGLKLNIPQFCVPHINNTKRCFYVFVPEKIQGKVPLVFDIHGQGSCPLFSVWYTKWHQKAKDNKFIAVWPLGVTDPNIAETSCFGLPGGKPITVDNQNKTIVATECCCQKKMSELQFVDYNLLKDDQFIRAAINYVVENIVDSQLSIDPSKIFISGHSNGGIAALSMAALHSDLISGVAIFAGKLLTPFPESYSPIPVWMVHGKRDRTIFYDGTIFGDVGFDSALNDFNYISDKNGCDSEIITSSIKEEEGTIKTRTNCVNGADVTLVTLDKGGHSPYQGFAAANTNVDAEVTVIDTTQLAWNFLVSTTASNDTKSGCEYTEGRSNLFWTLFVTLYLTKSL